MRFDTILDAHSYMKDYRIEEEEGNGVYVSENLYPTGYGDGRYVSWVCFRYVGADGDFDPNTCIGQTATVYRRSTIIVPGEMENTPFLDRDLGLPSTAMCVGNPIHLGTGNKFQSEQDYASSGAEPLTFTRYYNSSLSDAPMGG